MASFVLSLKVEEEKSGNWLQISFLGPLSDITAEDKGDLRNHSLPVPSPISQMSRSRRGGSNERRGFAARV